MIALLLRLGGFGSGASDHINSVTRGRSTVEKLPCDRKLKHGHHGGCDMDIGRWMMGVRLDGRRARDMVGIYCGGPDTFNNVLIISGSM